MPRFRFPYAPAPPTERIIDCQDWSSTCYLGTSCEPDRAFGVNFADGRIKGHPVAKAHLVRPLRARQFQLWTETTSTPTGMARSPMAPRASCGPQNDSGVGMDWQTALAGRRRRTPRRTVIRGLAPAERQGTAEHPGLRPAPQGDGPVKTRPAIDPCSAARPSPMKAAALTIPFTDQHQLQGWHPGWNPRGLRRVRPGVGFHASSRAAPPSNFWMSMEPAPSARSQGGQVTDYLLGTDATGKPAYGRGRKGMWCGSTTSCGWCGTPARKGFGPNGGLPLMNIFEVDSNPSPTSRRHAREGSRHPSTGTSSLSPVLRMGGGPLPASPFDAAHDASHVG